MRYDNVTFLVCLPRSRSAWLAQFLKPVAWTMHDPLKQCASIDELGEKIDCVLNTAGPMHPIFVADTAAVLFFDDIGRRFPDARYLFVERSEHAVAASLQAKGFSGSTILGEVRDSYARACVRSRARFDFAMHVRFGDIDRRLLNIWRFVGGENLMSMEYAERMRATNIQIPFSEQLANTDRVKVRRLLSRYNCK